MGFSKDDDFIDAKPNVSNATKKFQLEEL